jgi:23S rRNA (adenine2503-C2)-methyltransferase
MNLIPYNSLEADDYQRPDGERIVQIVRYLHSRGVLTKVRNSAGQDIDGGCGQLRARAVKVLGRRRLGERTAGV